MRAAPDARRFRELLAERSGEDAAAELAKLSSQRARSGQPADAAAFYAAKNASLERSLAFTGLYDADNYRAVFRQACAAPELFHGDVLDMGCDNGAVTCFLAWQFPEARFLGVDKEPAAVAAAQSLAEHLGLSNVRFQCGETEKQRFDCVFSMRTVPENIAGELPGRYLSLRERADVFAAGLFPHAGYLASLLRPGGRLISIERLEQSALILGWLQALRAAGTAPERVLALEGRELGAEANFIWIVAGTDAPAESDPTDLFRSLCPSLSGEELRGWRAEAALEGAQARPLRGVLFHDRAGSPCGRFELLEAEDGRVLIFNKLEETIFLHIYPPERRAGIEADFADHLRENEKRGYTTVPL